MEPTTREEAEQSLAQHRNVLLYSPHPPRGFESWTVDGPNRWTTHSWEACCGPPSLDREGVDDEVAWGVAVLEEPYFFIVTDADEVKARAVADAVAELLDDLPTRP